LPRKKYHSNAEEMDRKLFLSLQLWMTKVDISTVNEICRENCSTYSVIKNAFCCLQVKRELLFFKVHDEIEGNDSSQLKFEAFILLPKKDSMQSNQNPALFFMFDDECYFVNHPTMSQISIPKRNSRESKLPPSLLIAWPDQLEMRLFFGREVSDSEAFKRLSIVVNAMEDILTATLFVHPLLMPELKSKYFDESTIERKVKTTEDYLSNYLNYSELCVDIICDPKTSEDKLQELYKSITNREIVSSPKSKDAGKLMFIENGNNCNRIGKLFLSHLITGDNENRLKSELGKRKAALEGNISKTLFALHGDRNNPEALLV
jgi:hypothetical protein